MGTPLTAIDLKRLAAEVSVQHGIRIDPDDPILAVVTLNRLVFEHAVAQVLERMQSSVREYEAATEKVQIRAGALLAQEVRDCGAAFRKQFDVALEESSRSLSGRPSSKTRQVLPIRHSTGAVVGIALILFVAGIFLGATIRW
jgi:hypothetical protein